LCPELPDDKYFRHDPAGAKPEDVLHSLKVYLAWACRFLGFPFILDEQAEATASFVSIETRGMEGGHAVMAVGMMISSRFPTIQPCENLGCAAYPQFLGEGWGDLGTAGCLMSMCCVAWRGLLEHLEERNGGWIERLCGVMYAIVGNSPKKITLTSYLSNYNILEWLDKWDVDYGRQKLLKKL
jgi:hypothetical protein